MNLNVLLKLAFAFIFANKINIAKGDFITTQTGPKPIWNETHMDQLKKDLLVNYDRYARPAQYYNTTDVKIGLSLHHIEIDESKSTISTFANLNLVWTDTKLQWDPSHYNGISVMRLADHEIWQPDLYLYNSASGGESISRFGNPQVLLYSSGEVLWVPSLKFTSLCDFHLKNWPYDRQQCSLKFGSWTHNGQQLTLSLYNNLSYVQLELLTPNGAWRITNTTAEIIYKQKVQVFGSRYYAQFNISFTRVSEPYRATIITPLYVIAFLILMQFWLPPNAKEKLFLCGIIAIVVIMYLLYFTNFIITDGYNTTTIVSLYANSLLMISLSILLNIITFTLSTTAHSHSPPWMITKHLRGLLGKCLILVHYAGETFVVADDQDGSSSGSINQETGGQIIQKGAKYRIQGDWVLLTVAFDRIAFVIYSVIFLVSFIGYCN